jgi:hypothetical protein
MVATPSETLKTTAVRTLQSGHCSQDTAVRTTRGATLVVSPQASPKHGYSSRLIPSFSREFFRRRAKLSGCLLNHSLGTSTPGFC